MTSAEHTAINSASVGFLNRKLSRGDLGLLFLACFFIAAQPPLNGPPSFSVLFDALARQNLFFVFAILVAGRRFLFSSRSLSWSRSDWTLAGIGSLLFLVVCFLGVEWLAGAALTLVLIPLLLSNRRDIELTSGLLVCTALAINSFWGPLIFQNFTAQIIAFDTTLLKAAYALLRPDIRVEGVTFIQPSGFGIVLVGNCSVFNSASVAFLASTAMTQFIKPGIRRRDFLVLAVVLGAMIVINTCRMVLMGWDKHLFEFWHDGGGGPYIALAQTVSIAAIAFVGARWSVREPAS
jgi:hypothetical protein